MGLVKTFNHPLINGDCVGDIALLETEPLK